ncbi:MAG: phospholipase [Candidatus Harrisonbacteria bacterium CG10_big_fil_rev_8_21_14_0_10_42_17]|uniref:Phospholipase n=1 Tax=Candidatus Harrisonbacteria bacterium CG10_big_fil_rev_8_21_14_0_10_42_17 TaxID=1974584 RepID=A0A2M6WHT4_9BACT|nr:MAG: phospholipase [Candidatus Harrisonbacteria bacterium CG10_big_fil_rev_8_21_14_0_10_42_17]
MIRWLLRLFVFVLLVVGVYHVWKPLPTGLSIVDSVHMIPDSAVHFFSDVTFVDARGERHSEQGIFDEVFRMIRTAENYIILDMFLVNDFQGKVAYDVRPLSRELVDALIQRKKEIPALAVTFITDPVNSVYGGDPSELFSRLHSGGISVIETNLKPLRDSNPIYSSLWRLIIQWFGNASTGGHVPHPFSSLRQDVTLRSYLSLLNFKANHRKLIVADGYDDAGLPVLSTLITSANPHDGSSAHTNVALRVDDYSFSHDVIMSEQAVAHFSGTVLSDYENDVSRDEGGVVSVQLLTEGAIREQLLALFDSAQSGDPIDIHMFYLSERSLVEALLRAADRGALIRLLLDPNKDAFGREKNGIPNRPIAAELREKSKGTISIRWCDTHGEQCHSKLILARIGDVYHMMLGSANITRRNIGNYNLETDVYVIGDRTTTAILDARAYFERVWNNEEEKSYSADYSVYAENNFLKKVLYRVQEFSGLSSF